MFAKTIRMAVRIALAGATVSCTLLAAGAVADPHNVTVAISVSAQGLDVRHASGAQELYTRIRQAARYACTRTDRVGLAPVYDVRECVELAVGGAVRSANEPQLTQVYLANHTIREAAARGIETPTQLATK